MKLLLGYFFASLIGGAHSAASVASVYTFDSRPLQSPSTSTSDRVSPETARLILARRLELSQYHTLKGADDGTLQLLNEFGGSQERLLRVDQGYSGLGKLLVIVEGVQNPNRKHLQQSGIVLVLSL